MSRIRRHGGSQRPAEPLGCTIASYKCEEQWEIKAWKSCEKGTRCLGETETQLSSSLPIHSTFHSLYKKIREAQDQRAVRKQKLRGASQENIDTKHTASTKHVLSPPGMYWVPEQRLSLGATIRKTIATSLHDLQIPHAASYWLSLPHLSFSLTRN